MLTGTSPGAETYPKSLLQNSRKFEEFKRAYDPSALVVAAAALIVITALCQVGSWWLGGSFARDGLFGLVAPWVLLGISIGWMVATRRALTRGTRQGIPRELWVQSTFQIWWIGSVVWYAPSPIVLIMFLVVSIAATNDARYLYNTWEAHLSHLLPWLALPAVLLAVDWFGGPGVLARWDVDPTYVKYALAVLIGVLLLVQFVLSVVGRQCYEADAALWSRNKLESQLAEEGREREVLRRSCDLMVHGVSATSFSHDVASPLSLITMSADEILERLEGDCAGLQGAGLREQLQPAADQLRRATNRVMEMTAALARSLRHAEKPAQTNVRELVQGALDAARVALERYGLAGAPAPHQELIDAEVFVVEGHAGALANVIVNAVLQMPEQPVQLRGCVLNAGYYTLSVRDFGVDPEERPAALASVNASLALAATEDGKIPSQRPKHYGVALMLAKLLVVRHGGWLEVGSPTDGRGLVFSLTLPRHFPGRLPVAPPLVGATPSDPAAEISPQQLVSGVAS